MANIPVPDFSPPRSVDLPTMTPLQMQPNTAVADSLRGLGHTLGQAANDIGATIEKAQKEADALQLQDATNQLNAGNQAALLGDSSQGTDADGRPVAPGYLSLKGTDAHEGASKEIENSRKRRLDIANSLPANLRQRFLIGSEDKLLNFQAQVETHSAQEFRSAQGAVARDAQTNFLSNEANGIENAAGDQVGVEHSLRAASRDDAAGELAVRQFRSQIATTNIGRFSVQGNWSAARSAVDTYEEGGYLDAKTAAAARAQIDSAQKSGTDDAVQQRLNTGADAVISNLKTASVADGHDGFVDGAQMRADFAASMGKQTGLEPKHREFAVNAFNAAMARQNAWEQATVQGWRDTARKKNGFVTMELDRQLRAHDGDWWGRFKDIRMRKAEAAANNDQSAKEKLQVETDKLSLDEFRALSTQQKVSADVQQFADDRSMAADEKGNGVARQKLVTMQSRALEAVQKGYASDADEFANNAAAAVSNMRVAKTGAPSKTAIGIVQQKAWDEFDGFYRKHQRAPTEREATALMSGIVLSTARSWGVKITDGVSAGRAPTRSDARANLVPAAGQVSPSPVKTLTKYQMTPDQKWRKPVYSDGSVGPAEQVPIVIKKK